MLIFSWLILAVLVGVFASSRGRSGLGYFLLAVLLSPLIGFIWVLVLPNKTALVRHAELLAAVRGEPRKRDPILESMGVDQ